MIGHGYGLVEAGRAQGVAPTVLGEEPRHARRRRRVLRADAGLIAQFLFTMSHLSPGAPARRAGEGAAAPRGAERPGAGG